MRARHSWNTANAQYMLAVLTVPTELAPLANTEHKTSPCTSAKEISQLAEAEHLHPCPAEGKT